MPNSREGDRPAQERAQRERCRDQRIKAADDKVDKMFEAKLKRHIIRIKNLEEDRILTEKDMDYGRVLFDADLNIYKIKDGVPTLVDNDNFRAMLL